MLQPLEAAVYAELHIVMRPLRLQSGKLYSLLKQEAKSRRSEIKMLREEAKPSSVEATTTLRRYDDIPC